MSQFQMIRKIKQKKLLQTKKGKQESGWNERFYLEKIPDYTKTIEPNPCIQHYKNQFNSTKKQMASNHESGQINTYEIYFNLDPEIIELWNTLCVTDEYRQKFQQKLTYFKEDIHSLVLDYEKNSLKRVYEYIMLIRNELNIRDKSIELLIKLNEAIKAEKNIFNVDEDLMKKIKECLNHIKKNTISIVTFTNELRKIYYYDYVKGKFNKAKANTNDLFEPYFLSRLNQRVQFIFNSEPLRSFLQIQGQYDPLLMELFSNDTNEEETKALMNNCYIMLNEMVYSNYIPIKDKDSANIFRLNQSKKSTKSQSKSQSKVYIDNKNKGSINTKKYINNPYINNNSKEGEEWTIMNSENNKSYSKHAKNEDKYSLKNKKEIINCDRRDGKSKSNSQCANDEKSEKNESEKAFVLPQVNDDYIINDGDSKTLPKVKHNNNLIQKKEEDATRFEFYTGALSSIEKEYNQYYTRIPISQKNTFDLYNDLNLFTEGINPMLILGYKNASLSSLCLISIDIEDHQIVIIKQISTIENNINEIFLKIIMFIQDNISYKELLINLHFETNKKEYSLNKELTDIFKELNFKWSKLENLESGKRIQTMKYKNINTNNKETPNENPRYHLCHFKVGMIAWENEGDSKDDLSLGDNNSYYINKLNKIVIDNMMKQSAQATEIKNAFSNLISFKGSKEDTVNFLEENECQTVEFISQLDFIQREKKLYLSWYTLYPMFKTLSTRTINQYIYNRLEIKNEVLFEKNTNQTFYMLQQDDYVILLGEITPGFKDYLKSCKNIYEGFNSFYAKIEVIQKDIKHIWIPSFAFNEISTCFSSEQNITIKNYTNAFLNSNHYQGQTFNQEPQNTDCVIADSFFLAIISVNLLNLFDISAIFCDIINKKKWKAV